jgi:pimeloyl-ACP methyl ester carboxylesterase
LVAVSGIGLGVMFIVGRDGTLAWQMIRVLVVGLVTLIVLTVVRRWSEPRQAGVRFAYGLGAVAIGVGVGLPHALKVGVAPNTIAGLLCLVGGLGLAVAGGCVLVRGARRWHRLFIVPALLFATYATVWSLGQAIAATNVPRTSVDSTTPADLNVEYRDVEFRTNDGVRLSGWYIPSSNRAAVVMLHGAGSTRSSVLDHAVVLARHDYGVLLFDARGHGRSDGRAMDFGWFGDLDVAAAVSFLEEQPDVDDTRIAAVGMSMGGEEAIGAAASDGRIRAVVAEGATNRMSADRAWLSDEYGWRGVIQEGVEWLLYNTADVLTAAEPPRSLRAAVSAVAPRPVLLIAGGGVVEEGHASRYIQAASPDTVDIWLVSDTGHTAALDTHPDEWEDRVTTFLDDALGID